MKECRVPTPGFAILDNTTGHLVRAKRTSKVFWQRRSDAQSALNHLVRSYELHIRKWQPAAPKLDLQVVDMVLGEP